MLKLKKELLLSLMLLFIAALSISVLCFMGEYTAITANAASVKYKMTFSGTHTTRGWGFGEQTVDVKDKTSLSVSKAYGTGDKEEIILYLSGTSSQSGSVLKNDGYINFNSVTLSCSLSSVEIKLYNNSGTQLASGKGSISKSLSNGRYKVNLYRKIETGAGYTMWGYTINLNSYFQIDTTKPTISGASTSKTGKYTNSSFTVTAKDSGSGVALFYMKKPGSSTFTSSSSSSRTVSSGSTNGLYTFYAKDKAGNESAYYYVYYDNTVPIGTLKTAGGVSFASGGPINESFQYTATDSGSGIASLQYKKPNSSAWLNYTSGMPISAATSSNGWYYFRAMDKAGNYSAEKSVCLDTGKPSGRVYKENNSVSDGSIVKGSFIKFTASDTLSGVEACYVKKPGASSFLLYTDGTPLMEEGKYKFYAVDNAGNKSETYTIGLDNAKPTGILYGGNVVKTDGSIVNSNYIFFFGNGRLQRNFCIICKKTGF